MSFLGNLFGGGDTPQIQFTPPGFNAGGLNASFSGNGYNVTPTAARTDALGGLSGASASEADALGGLRASVAPGFNDLLSSRLTDLGNTARQSIGDLRQNLASRRILGSSFGNDTINRLQTSIGQQRDSVIADNFLKSLAVNQQLTQQEFAARRQQFQTGLDELNLEANLASQLTGQASTQLAANARAQAEIDAKAQQGSGQFLGGLLGKVVSPTLSGIGNAAAGFFGL